MGDVNGIKIIQTIASGGTAVLHKAVQTSLDRIVAVKRLHKHLTDDENFTRRFILEAKAAASLDHENIVHVIDFGRGEDGYEIVMEFVEGDSVKDILERWRPVRSSLALAIVHQICQGLEHAHAKGIVHRDIKPGNVMLTKYGRVKITDFGLAKLTEAAASFTADNSIIGTPLYMSPEQAFGESVDQRSDLFSLGTMLYELVTGKQPFASENYMGIIQNIIHKDIPTAREVNPDVPEEVEAILKRALNKDRDQRFQTAREFRKAIEDYIGIVELNRAGDNLKVLLERNTQTQVLPRPAPAAAKGARKRGVGRGVAAAVVALVLLGGTGAVLFRPDIVARFGGASQSEPTESTIQRSEAVFTPVGAAFDLGALADAAARGSTAAEDTVSREAEPVVETREAAAGDPDTTTTTATTATTATTTTTATTATEPAGEPEPEPPPEPVVRTGFLSVNATPSAEVYVDGVYRGDAPPALRLELVTGLHTLECRRPRHESYRESFRITAGELSTRNVTLRSQKGAISVNTQPGAQVFVDGKLLGVTPLQRPLEVEAGSHEVTIKKVGFNPWRSHIAVQAKQTLPLNITLSPKY